MKKIKNTGGFATSFNKVFTWLHPASIKTPIRVEIVSDKSRRYGKYLPVIQIVFTLITVACATYSVYQSIHNMPKTQEFTDTVTKNLNRLNTSFSNVEDKLNILPQSIGQFNSIIDSLNNQLNNMRSAIVVFESTLVDIKDVTQTQLAIIKETQRQWNEEASKKSNLILRTYNVTPSGDSLIILPEIVNAGDKMAKEAAILLIVPHDLKFNSVGWQVYDSAASIQVWSYNSMQFIGPIIENTDIMMTRSGPMMEFSIKIPKHVKKEILLQYIITSEYSKTDTLHIKIP